MGQKKKMLGIGVCILILLTAAILLLSNMSPMNGEEVPPEIFYIEERDPMEIVSVEVNNEHGFYSVTQEGGGFLVYDVPSDLVNGDYLELLLDECSRIAVRDVIKENAESLELYGLEKPRARVNILYKDYTAVTLLIGNVESMSDGVYMMVEGENTVYITPQANTIRFTMPVENYIQYQITPTKYTDSSLAVIRDITFSGTCLPEPIIIEYVDEKNEQHMRDAASFGVATHLIRSPGLHELDQSKGVSVFQSLLGIVSEEIIAYNCSEEILASYGFDRPYMIVDFSIVNGPEGTNLEAYCLKVVKSESGEFLMTCNENGVIYRILDVAFTSVVYEELVMRWFLTPFITDLETMTVITATDKMNFTFTGYKNKDLAVFLKGTPLDTELFRSYYRLVISACNDGSLRIKESPQGDPLFTVEFNYKDHKKANDVMKIYKGDFRRVYVEVNGNAEFAMKETYLNRVLEAGTNLQAGEPIEENW
ncbi:MAG: DUF4340 domain-containing protein [Eubacteriales bacterium]|nr:DUF4340 domain-containing protein [Eubacteriales bacterium]